MVQFPTIPGLPSAADVNPLPVASARCSPLRKQNSTELKPPTGNRTDIDRPECRVKCTGVTNTATAAFTSLPSLLFLYHCTHLILLLRTPPSLELHLLTVHSAGGTRSLVFTSLASTLPTSALDGTAAEGVGTLDGEERGVDEEGRGSLLVSRLACSTSTAARLTLLTPPPSACASASLSPYTPPVLCGGRAYNTGGTASCPRRSSFARQ